jgi:hypothetical protein
MPVPVPMREIFWDVPFGSSATKRVIVTLAAHPA